MANKMDHTHVRSRQVYHVYNQSNGYAPLFRETENYRFFLRKLRTHLLPVADLLCYCLMPDHFHLMLVPKPAGLLPSHGVRARRTEEQDGAPAYQQEISHQLRIMLSSYTRAFNRRYKTRGALFRASTHKKAITGANYLLTCFHYIHNNPVKDGLVLRPTDWEFSSARIYAGLRQATLCNVTLAGYILGVEFP